MTDQFYNGRKITSNYGERTHPTLNKKQFHSGLDLAYSDNEPLKAFTGGKVSFVGNDPFGFGNYLKIADESGREHQYAHLNKIDKKVGDLINVNDVIGLAGQTGRVTGPHVDYRIFEKGKAMNPSALVANAPQIKKVLGTGTMTGAAASPELQEAIQGYAQQLRTQRPNYELNPEEKQVQSMSLQNILSNLTPVERPKFMNVQDVFSAPKGEKLETALKYLTTSDKGHEFTDAIGNMFSGGYGGVNHAGKVKAEMLTAQGQADAINKDRLKLAYDLYKEGKLDERDLRDLAFKYENLDITSDFNNRKLAQDDNHFGQNINLEKEKFAFDKDYKDKTLELERTKTEKKTEGNPYNLTNPTISKIEQEEIQNNNIIDRMNVLNKIIEDGGNYFGFAKGAAMNSGKMGNAVLNRLDPNGVDARRIFAQQRDETIKAITGAQMSEAETKRLIQQMPSEYDSPEVMKSKIKSIKDDLDRKSKNNQRLLGRSLSNNQQSQNTQETGEFTIRLKN